MTKEAVYDTQISPLMAEILAICQEHKIAIVADFGLDGDLHCTSALLTEDYEPSEGQLTALKNLRHAEPVFVMAETTETLPSGAKKITLRRIS